MVLWACSGFPALAADDDSNSPGNLRLDCCRDGVWDSEVGCGFRKRAVEAGFSLGGGPGVQIFGSREPHALIIGETHIGTMLTGPICTNTWLRGNFEVLGTFFGGGQVNDDRGYVIGLTPLIRYNFATGSRFVPYVGGGAGVSYTDIRGPDLSTAFEFNVQAEIGIHWFFQPHMSATIEGRYMHLSNAGIEHPNNGVNAPMGMIGLNWWW